MRIGFIGLGSLGRHLAGSLLRAGFPVTVYDIDRSCAVDLGRGGRHLRGLGRGGGRASDTVITCLPSPEVVAARGRRDQAASSRGWRPAAPGST